MFVEPDKQDEPESEPIEAPVKSKSGGGKKLLVSTIVLAVLFAAAAGGAGYLFTQLDKTKTTLLGTEASLRKEKDKSATLEEEKTALGEEKARVDQDLAATKSALEATGKELESTKTARDEALASLAEKEKNEQALNKKLQGLEQALADAAKATSTLESQLAAADAKIKSLPKGQEGGDTAAKIERLVKDAQIKAEMAAAVQAEMDRMLGKAEAANLLRGTVSSVNALEKLVVINLGDKSAPTGKQFVISNKEHEYLATVALEVSQGNMAIARVLRPDGEVSVVIGDTAIEVPESALKRESKDAKESPKPAPEQAKPVEAKK